MNEKLTKEATPTMAIEIPISPDYKLTSDSLNIIVNERYFTDPTKAPNWPKKLAEGRTLTRRRRKSGAK